MRSEQQIQVIIFITQTFQIIPMPISFAYVSSTSHFVTGLEVPWPESLVVKNIKKNISFGDTQVLAGNVTRRYWLSIQLRFLLLWKEKSFHLKTGKRAQKNAFDKLHTEKSQHFGSMLLMHKDMNKIPSVYLASVLDKEKWTSRYRQTILQNTTATLKAVVDVYK